MNDDLSEQIESTLETLSLEEKAGLCSGADFWHLKGVAAKGVPSVMVADGPHGLRKQSGASDHVGIAESVPATCFPTASALAATWNVNLIQEVGAALGSEAHTEQVAVLLGPGANIKRSPTCGRNFEYFSEDPFLSGKLAASFIRGVQSTGTGTSLKHFAVNNQERRRMVIDAVVDDRALREIYLSGFEEAVIAGQPDTVMCAYNRVNGAYCSENRFLLSRVLKEEWGFEGFVVTDWGATNDRVKGLAAGLDLEMPSSYGVNDELIVRAVEDGTLGEDALDAAVRRILRVVFKTTQALKKPTRCNLDSHHDLARRAATEAAVLLKNDGILPLDRTRADRTRTESGVTRARIALVGAFAVTPRYQGSGSSLINPYRIENALDAVRAVAGDSAHIAYAPGYDPASERANRALIEEAVQQARDADVVVIFAGLPEVSESEGFDRSHVSLPAGHNALISAVAEANPQCVVVLSNGAPVAMPWLSQVRAVLETYLGGQAWGAAVADLLFGIENPSGRLAETFPHRLDDAPSQKNFPGGTAAVAYAESVYVGYRYFDTTAKEVLFPFGFGLSYTTFLYDRLTVRKLKNTVRVSFEITNSGTRAGSDTPQVYVRDVESTVFRPAKELKGFQKVALKAGETKRVVIDLDRRAFSFWDSGSQKWCVESGSFEILVAASVSDVRLRKTITYQSDDELSAWAKNLAELAPEYYSPESNDYSDLSRSGAFARLLGRAIPASDRGRSEAWNRTSTLEDIGATWIGRRVYKTFRKQLYREMGPNTEEKTRAMMAAIVREMPLRNIGMLSGGRMSLEDVDALLLLVNRRYIRGLRAVLKERKRRRNERLP